MNNPSSHGWIAVFAAFALLGCDPAPKAEPVQKDAEAKPEVAAERTTTKPAAKPSTAAETSPSVSKKEAPKKTEPAKAPAEEPAKKVELPAGGKGAIFMLKDGKARILDSKGTEVESYASDASGEYTFYDPTKGRVFVYNDSKIHAVDMGTKKTELFAQLPATKACKLGKNKLDMYSSWSLGLTSKGKALCVRLQDGTESNMKVAMGYQIDTSTKKVTAKVASDFDRSCSEPADEEFCLPDETISFAHKDPKKNLDDGMEVGRYECHVKHGGKTIKITRPKNHKKGSWCDLTLEGFTPSRRFIGVTTLLTEGDAIKRTLDVIDLKKGKVLGELRTTITPETRVDWDLDTDAMLVGNQLFLLGDASKIVKLHDSAIFLGGK